MGRTPVKQAILCISDIKLFYFIQFNFIVFLFYFLHFNYFSLLRYFLCFLNSLICFVPLTFKLNDYKSMSSFISNNYFYLILKFYSFIFSYFKAFTDIKGHCFKNRYHLTLWMVTESFMPFLYPFFLSSWSFIS